MAREEWDREDMMAEATGLPDRVELRLDSCRHPVIVGFRRNSAVSVYVGSDEVFQFNCAQQLRRGYWRGELIKAQGGRLVSLERRRDASQTVLVSRTLGEPEAVEFLKRTREVLDLLRTALRDSAFCISKVVSATDHDVVARVRRWVEDMADPVEVARGPGAGR